MALTTRRSSSAHKDSRVRDGQAARGESRMRDFAQEKGVSAKRVLAHGSRCAKPRAARDTGSLRTATKVLAHGHRETAIGRQGSVGQWTGWTLWTTWTKGSAWPKARRGTLRHDKAR
ncbi:MAG: hypothetical protein JWR26_1774 [Pedosphaera sp.]|nr:hypothetical protein [Pedosphaera sp.]